jgi:hypothetical protein
VIFLGVDKRSIKLAKLTHNGTVFVGGPHSTISVFVYPLSVEIQIFGGTVFGGEDAKWSIQTRVEQARDGVQSWKSNRGGLGELEMDGWRAGKVIAGRLNCRACKLMFGATLEVAVGEQLSKTWTEPLGMVE